MTALVGIRWMFTGQEAAGWLAGGLAWLRIWHGRHRSRRALAGLEIFQLADIGLTEAARRRECAKRFWQA